MRGCLVAVLVAAACGGGTGVPTADGGASDATSGDAASYPACAGFDASAVSVPARVISALGTAEVESPAACASVNAPFGIESAGPDRVIPLTNLTAGTPYVVRVTSASDLAFYVVTGCSTPTGPAADQCLLFEDATSGDREVGRFVAADVTAYVVVDFYASSAPANLAFTLDVYAEQCAGEMSAHPACGGGTPACFEGQCVGCVTSFDCPSADAPVCGGHQSCVAGVDTCTSDGLDEPSNDGPAGATPIVLDGLGDSTVTGKICSSPRTEADFLAFDVTTLGETWELQLAWLGNRDLDLTIYDPAGKELGMSYWEQPERVQLTYLPLGRYLVRVREFGSVADPAALAYTLTTRRTLGSACTSTADCADEYRNQIYRGSCFAGACVEIAGAGAITEGGACDSQSDCAAGLQCPSFYFVADSDTRETCAPGCTTDTECASFGADHVCTTYLTNNFCVQRCTENDHCPTSTSSRPALGPWVRLACDIPSGRCLP